MKKIIITLLTLVGISGMQAQTLPVDQAATKFEGAGLQIIVTGYGCTPESAYGCNDEFTIELAAGNTVNPTGDRVVGNAAHVYYACNAAPAAGAVNKYTLTHVPTGHCAVITMTGSACTAVTACGAVDPEPDPEPAAMLPVIQASSYFQGTGLFIKIDGWSNNPADTYYSSDDYTIVPDQSNTLTLGARTVGHNTHLHYKMSSFPANDDVINRFTVTHDDTGNCAVLTFTGYNCTAVEACGGAVGPDPEPDPEPSTIQFSSITFNNDLASITSNAFQGADEKNISVELFEGEEMTKIDASIYNKNGELLVVKNGAGYTSENFPYTFIITNTVNRSCGKLIASSATQFTQSACDETPELTPSVSIVQTESGPDYIDARWAISNYNANQVWIYYKKVGDAQYSKTDASISKPSVRILGLAAATTYVIKVRLEILDNEGEVVDYIESEETQATTTQATFTISQKGAYTNYLTIGWEANFTAELYTVRHRPTGSGLDYLQYELSGKATSATITGLDEHTSYDIQVVAQLSAAQGGSRTASGVFTTLDRTSCNTLSTEDEESDASFTQATTCEFKQPYEVEVYTSNLETKEVTIRYHYTQPENIADNQVILLKRKKDGNNLEQLSPYMTSEGNKWYKKVYQPSAEEILDGYVYFAIKVVTKEGCEGEGSHMYVTRKLNYKMGVGCNDATELEFTKGEGDKVFYLQSNATIARVEVYNPSKQLVATPAITKPGPNYVLNIADNTAFPPSNDPYTFMLYDINGRLSDIDLVYTIY